MVSTASNGFSTLLEGYLDRVRRSPERLDGSAGSAGSSQAMGPTGPRKVERPPMRLSGFFGSGM